MPNSGALPQLEPACSDVPQQVIVVLMNLYLETESEESERHGDNEDQEVVYQEMLVKAGLAEDLEAIAAKKAMDAVAVALVCSCGSKRCYMVRKYGLPVPVFHAEIEPVYPQSSRDLKALSLGSGTNGS